MITACRGQPATVSGFTLAADAHAAGRAYRARMDSLFSLSDVTKRYESDGRPAVDRVRLNVAPGEAVAVMGPSTAGFR
jgi:ABC-type transport system involved in cytochrome bd biosynthesis fused ATPase/permease subunit